MKNFQSFLIILGLLGTSSAYASTSISVEWINKGDKPIFIKVQDMQCVETYQRDFNVYSHETLRTHFKVDIGNPSCKAKDSAIALQVSNLNLLVEVKYSEWKKMEITTRPWQSGIEIRAYGDQGSVTFSKDVNKTSTKLNSSPPDFSAQNNTPKTFKDKLVAVALAPEYLSEHTEAPKPPTDLLADLQYTTAHLKVDTKPSNPHDVMAEIRQEALALADWIENNPAQKEHEVIERESRLMPELDKAITSNSLAQQNAVADQQKTNQIGKPIDSKPIDLNKH